jgi:hypothetical protein
VQAHVRILGWTHAVLGGLGLLVVLSAFSWLANDPGANERLRELVGWAAVLSGGAWFVPMLAGGIGLLRGARWARPLAWAESALLLGLFPIGTALAGYGIWVLSRPAPGPDFARLAKGVEQAVLLGGAALSILGVIVGIGYLFREQIEAGPPSWLLNAGAVVVGIALTVLIVSVVDKRSPFPSGAARKARGEAQALSAERVRRIERLRADPATAIYAVRMERGEWWSDERIAYDRDLSVTATCEHLAPLERAMRAQGVEVRLMMQGAVEAWCTIDGDGLARLSPAPCVAFVPERRTSERGFEDPPSSALTCSACRSWISAVHPSQADRDTPRFPS